MSESERRRLEALYVAHGKAILMYALRMTGSLPDAQEVVSETFLVAWRRVGDIPDQEPHLWLYSVAKKVLLNKSRSERRRGSLFQKASLHQATADEASGDVIDQRTDLMRVMNTLKPSHREALALAYWEDLEPAQAAKVMGRSSAAYNNLLHRARQALAKAIATQESELHGKEVSET